ncbi:hypothetical protein [Tolypothrix sp. NIES-4075]|nr:hypothetical protein [Tolypothrix sp. NIES-4075]
MSPAYGFLYACSAYGIGVAAIAHAPIGIKNTIAFLMAYKKTSDIPVS